MDGVRAHVPLCQPPAAAAAVKGSRGTERCDPVGIARAAPGTGLSRFSVEA
jgi:hypothetical protein